MEMSERYRDALEDCLSLPDVPDGYVRVLASDGGIHDIPIINFKFALKIDPKLAVLPKNPIPSLIHALWRDNRLNGYFAQAPSEWC